MKKKHTDGPWIRHNGAIYSAHKSGGKLYAEMAVAGVFAEEDEPLIAAAPELLSALVAMVEAWETGEGYSDKKNQIGNARKAIEKATGATR